MTMPESVQFFQFDAKGEGEAKFVAPGDELIFFTASQWHKRLTPLLSQIVMKEENAVASTCPEHVDTEPSWLFKLPLPKDKLTELSHKNFTSETLKKVRWVRKMYREWRAHHHGLGLEYIACDLEDRVTISEALLKFALCHFITEIKKVDGSDFPGKTLYDIIICMQFHLECMGFAFKIINSEAFCDVKYMLDNTMMSCVASGIGLSVKQAEILSVTDKDYLWSMGHLGTSNPDQLLNTVVFCVGKGFASRAGKEHQALRGIPFNSQFKFIHDTDNEVYLQYTEDIGLKTNKGGIKHKKV